MIPLDISSALRLVRPHKRLCRDCNIAVGALSPRRKPTAIEVTEGEEILKVGLAITFSLSYKNVALSPYHSLYLREE